VVTVKAVKRAALLLLMAAPLSGCGGGDGESLTREEYTRQADAICTKYNEQVRALQNPSNIEELADAADKTLPILDDAIGDLQELEPPESDAATAEAWLDQVELLKGDLEEIRDRAEDNDLPGVQAAVPSAQQHNDRSNELATQLGMSVCNMG
jgi:hypothetical protein